MNLKPADPYRPPNEPEKRDASAPTAAVLVAATLLWSALAIKVVVAGYFFRPLAADLEVDLPFVSQLVLHPMASVLAIVTTSALILIGFSLESDAKKYQLGRIALALGLVTFLIGLLGLLLPLAVHS